MFSPPEPLDPLAMARLALVRCQTYNTDGDFDAAGRWADVASRWFAQAAQAVKVES